MRRGYRAGAQGGDRFEGQEPDLRALDARAAAAGLLTLLLAASGRRSPRVLGACSSWLHGAPLTHVTTMWSGPVAPMSGPRSWSSSSCWSTACPFGFAAGAMLALVVVEVLSGVLRDGPAKAILGILLGAAAMLALSAALGV
jgi:zinc transporter ZupT